MEAEQLLDGLTPAQRHAVTNDGAPLRILAGAGSGKTRVLTRRVAWRAMTGDLDPRRVLALTFTRRAAGELADRLRRLGLRDEVAVGTFHSVAYAQLRARWADTGTAPPELLDRKAGVAGRVLRAAGGAGRMSVAELVQEIEWAQAQQVGPEGYPAAAARAGRRPSAPAEAVARLLDAYQEEKRRRRLVDFDDLLAGCARALREDPTFGAAQRWRHRHLFVDEFQDVNPLQLDLLQSWRDGRPDLCVVGDPNQAIYAWNGADASFLVDFEAHFPGSTTVELPDNHRSSPQIVAVADAVLGRPPAARLARRPDGPVPSVADHPDDVAEAAAVARAVRDHHRPGGAWGRQAVLVRTNAQTGLLAEALAEAGIPARVRGGAGLLERPEVKRALADLRRAPADDLAAVTAELERATDADAEVAASLAELARLARRYAGLDTSPTVPGLLAWLATAATGDTRGDAVDVTTFHAAKGLEWPVVHLAGLEDGYVPIGHARSQAELDEERRLLHVALTRAEQEACLTWARRRQLGSRRVARQPSPFLAEVEPVRQALAGPDRARKAPRPGAAPRRPADAAPVNRRTHVPVGGARRASGTGRRPGHVAADDAALWEALRRWRAGVARAGQVDEAVVLDDRALDAAVAARPADLDELLAVEGFGPVRARRYGEAILAAVRDHPRSAVAG